MKATYIAGSGGEGTAATIEIDGQQYECMDCLGYGQGRACRPGDVVNVALEAGLVRLPIDANPERRKDLVSLGGWRYRAYGEVVEGTLLDCGTVRIEIPDLNGAERFVAVDIERLDCWRMREA